MPEKEIKINGITKHDLPYSNEEDNNVIVKFSPFTNLPIYLTINDTTYKLNEVEKLSNYYTRR